jgi:hypothetical protein
MLGKSLGRVFTQILVGNEINLTDEGLFTRKHLIAELEIKVHRGTELVGGPENLEDEENLRNKVYQMSKAERHLG